MAPASPALLAAFTYEREPGAASRPLPRGWRRRQPEQTALYAVVQEHLETFLQHARDADPAGSGLPRFIEGELRRYLDCGLLSQGFARLRCASCGDERLVALSSKGRMCPSCWARRAADTAADLPNRVGRLLPDVPKRQWVLTFPWELRFRLPCDRALHSRMLQVFLRTLFAWQRRRGRALGVADTTCAQTGSVTFIQRFTQDLRLFPHVHVVVPDGLFTLPDGGTELPFHALPPPTDSDVRALTERLAERLQTAALRRGTPPTLTDGEEGEAEDALVRSCAAAALRRQPAKPAPATPSHHVTAKPLCASVAGFSLHAAGAVAADDRPGLERLCRYGLRTPFSLDRFSLTRDGRVRYELRKAMATGRAELLLGPLDLLRRLVALLPAPYENLVRHHGVFANRSRHRALLPRPAASRPPDHPCSQPAATPADPQRDAQDPGSGAVAQAPAAPDPAQPPTPPFGATRPAPPDTDTPDETTAAGPRPAGAGAAPSGSTPTPRSLPAGSSPHASPLPPRRHLSWAAPLLRTLDVDVLTCARCATPIVLLAFLTDPRVVKRILTHFGLPTAPPPLARAHDPQPAFEGAPDRTDELPCSQVLHDGPEAPAGRSPPRAPQRRVPAVKGAAVVQPC